MVGIGKRGDCHRNAIDSTGQTDAISVVHILLREYASPSPLLFVIANIIAMIWCVANGEGDRLLLCIAS